jgi:hypothetical protein
MTKRKKEKNGYTMDERNKRREGEINKGRTG